MSKRDIIQPPNLPFFVEEDKMFTILSYGIIVTVHGPLSLLPELSSVAQRAFPNDFKFVDNSSRADHTFIFEENGSISFSLIRDSDPPILGLSKDTALELFIRMIRLMVSEDAKDHLFLHAGVVAIGDKALIFPGKSGAGKTSLTIALIKQGAIYYSDEYAVIDRSGSVHPFTRDLSVKTDTVPWSEKNGITPRAFGASSGTLSLKIGLVVFTEFSPSANSDFEHLSIGQGILAAIPHAITFSKRPDFSLKLLNCAFSRAIILRGLRGESDLAANQILSRL